MTTSSTASPDEIAKFTALADTWWDPSGAFRPLHKFNPARIRFLRDRLARHFRRPDTIDKPFTGLRLLDIGCGGGLLAEPMSRLGFSVSGVDAGEDNIGVARVHAERMGLEIIYEPATPEQLTDRGERFDVVLAMEVIEHVADVDAFVAAAAKLVAPGGILIAATLNRTLKSLALAKIGAEYILRWVPAGTHDWRKFVKPSELAASFRRSGVTLGDLIGMRYDVFTDRWETCRSLDVNYIAVGTRSDERSAD